MTDPPEIVREIPRKPQIEAENRATVARVRDQALSNQDWPIAQVPRERLSRFRNDTRMKSWSFMTWMWAAYPDKWLDMFLGLPDAEKKIPTLEDVEAVVTEKVGKSTEQLDAEWREWARGDSGVAFGTGYGPPQLPERPSCITPTSVWRRCRINLNLKSWPMILCFNSSRRTATKKWCESSKRHRSR